VRLEVSPNLHFVEGRDAQRQVIDIPRGLSGRGSPKLAERPCGVDQIDQMVAGPQLYETERFKAALLPTAEDFAVEPQRLIELRHAQDDVIDADDVDCTHVQDGTPRAEVRESSPGASDLTGAERPRTMRDPSRSG